MDFTIFELKVRDRSGGTRPSAHASAFAFVLTVVKELYRLLQKQQRSIKDDLFPSSSK